MSAAPDGVLAVRLAVRGGATPEELAAVVAALAQRPAVVGDRYERWRRARLAALAYGRSGTVCQIGRPQGPPLSTDRGEGLRG